MSPNQDYVCGSVIDCLIFCLSERQNFAVDIYSTFVTLTTQKGDIWLPEDIWINPITFLICLARSRFSTDSKTTI